MNQDWWKGFILPHCCALNGGREVCGLAEMISLTTARKSLFKSFKWLNQQILTMMLSWISAATHHKRLGLCCYIIQVSDVNSPYTMWFGSMYFVMYRILSVSQTPHCSICSPMEEVTLQMKSCRCNDVTVTLTPTVCNGGRSSSVWLHLSFHSNLSNVVLDLRLWFSICQTV